MYVADEQGDVPELFSARVDGSAPAQRLNAPFTAAQGFGPLGPHFAITLTSDRVLYGADQETDGALELWSAPIDGSAPAVRISTVFAPGTEVLPYLVLAPGGERVV